MFTKKDISALTSVESLFNYNDYEFEYACKYLLEKSGKFKNIWVTSKGPKGGDGGVDFKVANSNGASIMYGQCKQWHNTNNRLIRSIRELCGCMSPDGVKQGLLLTTAIANEYEKKEAARRCIEIIDAPALEKIISTLNASSPKNIELTQHPHHIHKEVGFNFFLKLCIAALITWGIFTQNLSPWFLCAVFVILLG